MARKTTLFLAERTARRPENQAASYRDALASFCDALSLAGDARSENVRAWIKVGYLFEDAMAPLVKKGLRINY